MKKYFILLFLMISFNCMAESYVILSKLYCNEIFIKLKEQNRKIIEVRNLDLDKNGNILIIYE